MSVRVVRYQRARHRLSGIGTTLVLADKHKHQQTDKQYPGDGTIHVRNDGRPNGDPLPVVGKK